MTRGPGKPSGQMARRRMAASVLVVTAASVAVMTAGMPAPDAQQFSYNPPGELVSGSGTGREDETVYVPGMRFPIEVAPAYANSQVWGNGGMYGPGGSQCDEVNYSYPWWDTFCESRTWEMPLCPTGEGHQGQDIRPSTCLANVHWAVAAEDGTVTSIGTYSLYLEGESGTLHRYLHMEPTSIPVSVGDEVTRGQRLGRVSNAFGGTPTTIHLHYDLNQYVAGFGNVYVPPYMSLVRSYEELPGIEPEPCPALPPEGGILDDGGPCFRLHGPMSSWRYVTTAGYGGALYWTYAWENALSNWAEWLIDLERAGEYTIEVYIEAGFGESEEARYMIRHGGIDEEIRLDQSAGAGWVTLGTFGFAQGGDQSVSVNDNTGELVALQRQLVADAIRISSQDPIEPDVEPEADEEPDLDPADDPPDAGVDPIADPNPDSVPDTEEPEAALEDPLVDPTTAPTGFGRFGMSSGYDGCGCGMAPVGRRNPPSWLLLLASVRVVVRRRCRSRGTAANHPR